MATAEVRRGALASSAAMGATGAASLAEVAAKLVDVCSSAQRSAMWPKGRPVTVRELNARIEQALRTRDGNDPVYALALALSKGRRSLNAVCDDAARPDFGAGGPRRKPLLRAVRARETSQLGYAPVVLPQSHADAWAAWQALQKRGATARVNELFDELEAAAACKAASRCRVVQAITATRRVIAARAVGELISASQQLLDWAVTISSSLHDQVEKRHLLLKTMRGTWPDMPVLVREAKKRLRVFDLDLDEVMAAPRPTMTSEAYRALLPENITFDAPASVVAAGATRVRRVAAPTRGASRPGERRADTYLLDWGDAVLDAAQQASLLRLASLLAAGRVLGRRVVHPKLVRQLLGSTEPSVRDTGLAALILVGDTAHLGRELRRTVRGAGLPADVGKAKGVVELAFWADAETRALVGKLGRVHPAQAVRRSAERVCRALP